LRWLTIALLAGARLKGADVFHAGISTHLVSSAQLPALEAELAGAASDSDVKAVLAAFHDHNLPPASFATHTVWLGYSGVFGVWVFFFSFFFYQTCQRDGAGLGCDGRVFWC
jgi:hypothetical protein